jgi:hypothetical protein
LSNFDDDVSRRIQHLRVEKIEADERQRRALDAKHAQYAEPADLIQKTLGQSPFEVFPTKITDEAEENWDYEHVLPDEGLCIVVRWRDSDEEVGLVGHDTRGLLFEPCPDLDVSSFFELTSGHERQEFALKIREMLVEGLARFALRRGE